MGTSNSAAAWVDDAGRTAMLRNSEGDTITPSVVLFDDSEVIVGKEARRLAPLHPDRVAQWVKRDMGRPVYSRPIRGEHLPPEVIQACILRKIKADIFAALGPAARAVITVPAYFDEPRRKATADAGEMAGLTFLDIVNEPTAAALGFGEALGYLSPEGKPLQEMVVMVYDLGGGTFDATLLRLAPGDIRTLATDGDVQLGGHDWDARLVNYAAEAFRQAHGCDPREDPAALNRLDTAAVDAKHTLTARSRAVIRVEHAGQVCEAPIAREQFEEMTADLLERTAYTSRQLLAAARLEWRDVSRLLLVGGSTRMPMVARMLEALTGLVPDRTVNPDEAVARGAAIYAHYLLARQRGPAAVKFQVTDVNSHSLGIEGIDPQTYRKVNIVLIPRNTPLPAKVTQKFMTKTEGQRSIVVQVLEGESSMPGECTAIGRTVIRDLPAGLPRAWPIEVTFEYGSNGRLTVLAVVPGTHRQVVLDLERDVGLSREGISRWKKTMGSGSGFDGFESMVQETLNLPAVPPAQVPPMPPAAGQPPSRPAAPQEPVPATVVPPAVVPASVVPLQPAPAQVVPPSVPPAATPPAAYISQPAPLYASAPAAPAGPVPAQPAPLFPQPEPLQPQHAPPGAPSGAPRGGLPDPAAGLPASPPMRPAALAPSGPPAPPASGKYRWLLNLVGYGLSAIIGIAVGYLLISWLFPGRVPRLW